MSNIHPTPNDFALNLNKELAQMHDWHNAVIFNDNGKILSSTCEVDNTDFNQISNAFEDRAQAISTGFFFMGKRFEIYRWYPPLVMGRSGLPSESVGISVLKGTYSNEGSNVFLVVTYKLPNLSSKIVPQMENFFKEKVGHLDPFPKSPLVNHPQWKQINEGAG